MRIEIKNRSYSLLYSVLFLPLATVRILLKAYKNPEYLVRLGERFAVYNNNANLLSKYDLWLHTVSVGEFLAAKTLLDNIIDNNPGVKILITATTPTASKLIKDYLENNKQYNLSHVYYPYDVKFICNRFLNKFNPKTVVFFETELWPRMYSKLNEKGIKLYLLNARISEKSFNGYLKIKNYISTVINQINYIAAQSESDKNRLQKLGFENEIHVYGNIKYNFKLPEDLDEQSKLYRRFIGENRKILIGASTHKGEEEVLIHIYRRLRSKYNDLALILVPRHPERFDDVYKLCLSNNLTVVRYSDLDLTFIPSQENNMYVNKNNIDVFLLDTIGKLLYFYNISTLAFVGGSLVDIGGHNPLEPARLKVPSIIGPHYANFKQIVNDLADNTGIIKLNANSELEEKITKLLDSKEERDAIAISAFDYMQKQQGVMQRYLDLINNCLL